MSASATRRSPNPPPPPHRRRRADRRPRRQERPGDARPPAAAQPGVREDHRHGHARSEGRAACQTHAAPREGAARGEHRGAGGRGMKFATLIRRNLFRNKLRSFLMIVLMGAIFFLIAALIQILDAFDNFDTGGAGDRLVVQSAFSLATMLPYAHEQKLRQVPGVVDVSKSQWLGGYYKERRNTFAILTLDAEKVSAMFPEMNVDAKQMADLVHEPPRGARVSRRPR